MFYDRTTASVIAGGKSRFAIGLYNGEVFVYDRAVPQGIKRLEHRGAVKLLKYSATGTL